MTEVIRVTDRDIGCTEDMEPNYPHYSYEPWTKLLLPATTTAAAADRRSDRQ
jgi:hypothetical protein